MNEDLLKHFEPISEVVFNISPILKTSNEKNFVVGLLIGAGYKFGKVYRLYLGSVHGF